jgi:nucleotide sugar dehydrogenase
VRTIGNALIKDCINTTLSYSPAFIAQGEIVHGLRHPDIALIGEGTLEAGDIIEMLYHTMCHNNPPICRMSPDSAEITKLAVNCFITTKIAYANMIGDIADNTQGADKHAILEAVGKDTRIGRRCLKAGYGFGGPCFPRDNRALGNYAQAVGITPYIPQATDTANREHAQHMADRLLSEDRELYIFNDVAYKDRCAVPIIEESQKLAVAAKLADTGKRICIADTEAIINEVQRVFGTAFEYQII